MLIYLAWIFLSMTTLIWQLNKKHNSLDKCTLIQSMHTNKRSTCDQNLNKKINACTQMVITTGDFKYKYL